jgi:hypothetical protein
MTKTYQGWTNYPTWAVKLWLDNDEGLYYQYRTLNRTHRDINSLARALQDLIDELMPSPRGLAGDLLGYSLEIVNWHEIAEAIREDFPIDDDE